MMHCSWEGDGSILKQGTVAYHWVWHSCVVFIIDYVKPILWRTKHQ